MLPNEARKIVCNRTATPQVEKKRVVWRWDDNVRDEDQPRSASAGGQGDIQNGTPNEGRVAGAGGAQEEQRPLGSTANEAVERLERDGRGRRTGDGEFVRSLQLGDVVTVWAKARFPAWANNVNKITVDVYFAV